MIGSKARRVLLAMLVVAGISVAGAACHYHDDDDWYDDDEIAFEVHNLHQHDIWVEGVDGGDGVYFGSVEESDEDLFVVDEYWEGRLLRARCELDGTILETRIADDGMHWDVD